VSAHAASHRPALPALLLTVAALALGGLARLPDPAPQRVVLADRPVAIVALADESQQAAVLGRPAIRRTVALKVAAKSKPGPRVIRPSALRAARSKRVEVVPAGYVCPVSGPRSFTDSWGAPRPGGRSHQGTDVLAPYGAPVVAVISGVIQTNYSANGGLSLYLRGVDGTQYFYAHNSRNVAVDGQRVATGQLIGYVGNSGDARGGPPHVHFERHPGGGRPVNPYPFVLNACS